MSPRILNGVAIAADIHAETRLEVEKLSQHNITPGLAVVLVGSDPASEIYVRNKVRACADLGMYSILITPPDTVSTGELLGIVDGLNRRDDIDGILVQLPLPKQVDTKRILEAVLPEKDVDGFHPINVGRLQIGQQSLAPCTPAGILEILKRSGIPLAGRDCVMVGRSDIVGKPASTMLLNESATVSVCHAHTRDLARYTRMAEILIVAVGKPGLIHAGMITPGAVLIDVGINRITDPADLQRFYPGDTARAEIFHKRGSTLVGDIHPAAYAISGAYTPVPGGVGALTIAMLMQNTIKAAKLRRNLPT